MQDYVSKWHKELSLFASIKSVLILEGNVLDCYQYPTDGSLPRGSILRLPEYLHHFFKDLSYRNIVFYNTLDGFYNKVEEGYVERFAKLVGISTSAKRISAEFKGADASAPQYIKTAMEQSLEATAIVMDFASRAIVSPDMMDQREVDSFTRLLQASLAAKDVRVGGEMRKNILVMIVNKVNDLPAWFYLQNPASKSITLSYPTKEEREALVKGENFRSFFAPDVYQAEIGAYDATPDELLKIQDRFVGLTEGFSFTELNELRRLSKRERLSVSRLSDVVDLYRYGVRENPWRRLDRERIKNGAAFFEKRVKGQSGAITKTLNVIKRAVMAGDCGNKRPRGVLFFAGPTGTGKTETAKTLAELLFGDESACIRFDMSEYRQSHSDQKLLGAPPGYIGYEAGGQLTNAVKKHPFSVLLFDEIEKADPSILDKFLQILDDGRMTDGQGNTVYFSECVIIFTSNLGMYTETADGRRCPRVTSKESYRELAPILKGAIEDHFKLTLGKPELLNRIGDNIVIYDFIRPDVAREILSAQVAALLSRHTTERGIRVTLADEAFDYLYERVLDSLENNGRGIRNVVQSYLEELLDGYLFDHDVADGARVTVLRFFEDGNTTAIQAIVE